MAGLDGERVETLSESNPSDTTAILFHFTARSDYESCHPLPYCPDIQGEAETMQLGEHIAEDDEDNRPLSANIRENRPTAKAKSSLWTVRPKAKGTAKATAKKQPKAKAKQQPKAESTKDEVEETPAEDEAADDDQSKQATAADDNTHKDQTAAAAAKLKAKAKAKATAKAKASNKKPKSKAKPKARAKAGRWFGETGTTKPSASGGRSKQLKRKPASHPASTDRNA